MNHNIRNVIVVVDTKEFKIYGDVLYTSNETTVEHYCSILNLDDKEEFDALHSLDAFPEKTANWHTRYMVMSLSQAILLFQTESYSRGEQRGWDEGYFMAKIDNLNFNP